MRVTTEWIRPVRLLWGTWTIVVVGAYLAPRSDLYAAYGFTTVFTYEGVIWIAASLLCFGFGALCGSPGVHRHLDRVDCLQQKAYSLGKSVRLARALGVVLCGLLLLWAGAVVRRLGGGMVFVKTLAQDWHAVRDLWRQVKFFPGARLLYTGLISLAVYSAAALGLLQPSGMSAEDADRRMAASLRSMLIGSLGALFLLPLFASQRLLFVTALVGSVSAYLMTVDRSVSLRLVVKALLVGLALWTIQEVLRTGFVEGGVISSLEYGLKRLSFYFANNLGNVTRGVTFVQERSYGLLSLDFLWEFTFLADIVSGAYLPSFSSNASKYLGGGTWTGLGTPYMDFGIAGLLVVFLWGFVAQEVFHRARTSFFGAQVYGLIAASIVLSFQTQVWSQSFFWLNLALLVFLNSNVAFRSCELSRGLTRRRPR